MANSVSGVKMIDPKRWACYNNPKVSWQREEYDAEYDLSDILPQFPMENVVHVIKNAD